MPGLRSIQFVRFSGGFSGLTRCIKYIRLLHPFAFYKGLPFYGARGHPFHDLFLEQDVDRDRRQCGHA